MRITKAGAVRKIHLLSLIRAARGNAIKHFLREYRETREQAVHSGKYGRRLKGDKRSDIMKQEENMDFLQRVYEKGKKNYGEYAKRLLDMEYGYIEKNKEVFSIAADAAEISKKCGYQIFTAGAAGSSMTLFFMGVTDINPMPPHYICDKCGYMEIYEKEEDGFDMPQKKCAVCGSELRADGHNIPFISFAGLNGEKKPDLAFLISGHIADKLTAKLKSRGLRVVCNTKLGDILIYLKNSVLPDVRFLFNKYSDIIYELEQKTNIKYDTVPVVASDGKADYLADILGWDMWDGEVYNYTGYYKINEYCKPKKFSDYAKMNGYINSTDTESIFSGKHFAHREDIYLYMKQLGHSDKDAYEIMYSMHGEKILYPKAYNILSMIIGFKLIWYKKNYPYEFDCVMEKHFIR